MSRDLRLFGATMSAAEVESFLQRVMSANQSRQKDGEVSVPVCIWGTHGIGKTELVERFAAANNWQFAYVAAAQFEEMGDLHGLPVMIDGKTHFAAPDWVPTTPGPGILLLDDFNRADDRILRGIMQLLQRSEMVSWSLPEQWQIVVTANPEGGDYSVTPIDDAMLTRMLHVTLDFDATVWARWATDEGIDERGINFVLTYPELVAGSRTTPRSLTQFFVQIKSIDDLEHDCDHVYALARSSLDDTTATAFMAFVSDGLTTLVSPTDILDATNVKSVRKAIDTIATDDNGVRLDRLNAVCVRLFLALTAEDYVPARPHKKNLVAFLTHAEIPNDLRVTLHRDLLRDGSKEVAEMMRDKEFAELALAGM